MLLLFLLLVQTALAQEAKNKFYKVTGFVKGTWGEKLEGAFLVIMPIRKGVLTDKQGRFEVMLEKGTYDLTCQYVGMTPLQQTITIDGDKQVELTLVKANFRLKEVEITSSSAADASSVHMGSTFMDQKLLTRMPKLMGEVDVIRAVSALPGVVSSGEGTSGFLVRGGGADQNLVLMDDVPVFNSGHLFGFFSVYNPDILKSFVLHRNGISAKYGGRISSILDVSLRDGNQDEMRYEVGLSPVTAKLSMDGPLTEKLTMLVGFRGAFPHYALKLFPSENIKKSSGHFYDGNIKFKYRINENNSISFSGYHSSDGFKFPSDTTYQWTNKLGSLKWSHLFNTGFAGTITLGKSIYKNTTKGIAIGEEFDLNSGIDLSQVKLDFGYFGRERHQVDIGGEVSHYTIQPGDLRPYGTSSLNPRKLEEDVGYETAVYLNDEVQLNKKISFSVGVRYSFFAKVGPAGTYLFADGLPRAEHSIIDTVYHEKGSVVQTYQGLEPRASVKYALAPHAALKLGYSRTRQYIQLISNTAAITPVDVWKLSNKYLKPQIADQLSLGYTYVRPDSRYELSWETYYKKLYNQVDYKDGAVILLNPALEADLLFGEGYAYGSEWMLKKNMGRLTGWVSFTYSRSFRKIHGETKEESINGGKAYPANYDKPVNLNLFADYHAWPKWKVSANFTYTSGRPITASDSWYWYQGQIYANYSGRNQERMPDYHRLDVSLNHDPIKKKKAEYTWGISVYNLYGRKNAYSTLFQHYYGTPPQAYKLSIIGAPIPSLNLNVKF